MMAVHGQLNPFDCAVEDWKTFIEGAELYFTVNGIVAEEKKRGVLLSSGGPTIYTLIKNIVAPKKPAEIPYADLEKTIGSHYKGKQYSGVCSTLAYEERGNRSLRTSLS